jgi:hypothetical protein
MVRPCLKEKKKIEWAGKRKEELEFPNLQKFWLFFMVIRMARNEARLLGSVITQGESQWVQMQFTLLGKVDSSLSFPFFFFDGGGVVMGSCCVAQTGPKLQVILPFSLHSGWITDACHHSQLTKYTLDPFLLITKSSKIFESQWGCDY